MGGRANPLKLIPRIGGAIVGGLIGGPAGAALGAGLGTVATGGNRHEALRSGLLSGVGGAIGGAVGGSVLGVSGQTLGQVGGSIVGGKAVDMRKEMYKQSLIEAQIASQGLDDIRFAPSSIGEVLGTQPISVRGVGPVSPFMKNLNKRHQGPYGYRNWKRLMKKKKNEPRKFFTTEA